MSPDNTNDEIAHAVSSAPMGTYKLYHGTGTGVENNILTHQGNMREIGYRINYAKSVNCQIEVISIRLQIIDYWLRIFFVNKANDTEQREREFGRLLQQCNRLGLSDELFTELQVFNKHRINTIHGYVVGFTSYEELVKIASNSESLSAKVITFVLLNCGEVITKFDGYFNVGDQIINVSAYIQQLQDIRL